jgi:hypothetical protein
MGKKKINEVCGMLACCCVFVDIGRSLFLGCLMKIKFANQKKKKHTLHEAGENLKIGDEPPLQLLAPSCMVAEANWLIHWSWRVEPSPFKGT